MTQVYDQYGRPQKSSAPLIVGLCAGFGLILLLVLYFTGALDLMTGRGKPAEVVSAAPVASPTVAPSTSPSGPSAAAPANMAAPTPAQAQAPAQPQLTQDEIFAAQAAGLTPGDEINDRFLFGRWCDGAGERLTFDTTSGTVHNGTSYNNYSLQGRVLSIDTGQGNYEVTAEYMEPYVMGWMEINNNNNIRTWRRC